MIKILIAAILMLIMPCFADVSASIHMFSGQTDLTTSVSLDSGIFHIGMLLVPGSIEMEGMGSVTGNCSSELDYLDPFVKYSESFNSNNRDTKWIYETNNNLIKSMISSKGLDPGDLTGNL